MLIWIFFAIKRVNSNPPDLFVISSVTTEREGKVANIPPQLGPAILLINTTPLMIKPLRSDFNQTGLPMIFLGIFVALIEIFFETHDIESTIRNNHATTDIVRLEGFKIETNIAHMNHTAKELIRALAKFVFDRRR